MMKPLIAGLIAAVLLGCSSQLKFDKSESPPSVPIANELPGPEIEAPSFRPDPEPRPHKKSPSLQVPADTPENGVSKPCRNIQDEDLWHEFRLKLTCIEENVKK